jgi:hypothetical protein
MITGKAIARAIRAHLLTDEALISILLNSVKEQIEPHIEEVKKLHEKLLKNEITAATASSALQHIVDIIESTFASAAKKSRTTKLWRQYHEHITLLRLYICAERTGDWNLHLYCVKKNNSYFCRNWS